MSSPIRIALIGAGAFGVALLETLQQIRDIEVLAVADADLTRAKTVASRFAARHAMSNMLEAIRTDGVNTVFVATPETMHVESVLAALDAGKDVFVEKPLAHDSASARKLVKAWKESGRIVMPGHM